MSVPQIVARIPHRAGMLLIDRVLELVPDQHVRAVKAVSFAEPWYQRLRTPLTDDDLAYPPALLLESWNQAAAVLATAERPNTDVRRGLVMMLGSATGIRFARPVRPGELLEHRVSLVRRIGDTMIFAGDTTVGGETAMTVDSVVLAQRPAARLVDTAPAGQGER
ncbi:3-hydroxyacyl-ACP dehydratase FabZ family protein [Actinocatenispora comari]|jgi:3-hydroxyacyl-[acyl-carrier-protein] dehydratase|nr:beta-hydroxyacyl-ACP dehydratase [Actinocatenispora comari]